MKFLHKLAYKLGELTTKAPKLSTKPIKSLYNEFKQGREDSKGAKVHEPTTINVEL